MGGWVTELLDRFPRRDDKATYDRLTITVLEADPHRVNTVRVDLKPEEE